LLIPVLIALLDVALLKTSTLMAMLSGAWGRNRVGAREVRPDDGNAHTSGDVGNTPETNVPKRGPDDTRWDAEDHPDWSSAAIGSKGVPFETFVVERLGWHQGPHR